MVAKGTCSPTEAMAVQRSMAALMPGKNLTAALAPLLDLRAGAEAAQEEITCA
jgi:hypothetical protein